jgi:hypothetical protein
MTHESREGENRLRPNSNIINQVFLGLELGVLDKGSTAAASEILLPAKLKLSELPYICMN